MDSDVPAFHSALGGPCLFVRIEKSSCPEPMVAMEESWSSQVLTQPVLFLAAVLSSGVTCSVSDRWIAISRKGS